MILQPELMGIYLPGAGPWAVWSGPCSRGIPLSFYPALVRVGLPICYLSAPHYIATSLPVSVSLSLLPVWMNVASLNPWFLGTSIQLDFLTVLGDTCFVV